MSELFTRRMSPSHRLASSPVEDPPLPQPIQLSTHSTPAVPDSAWCSENLMLGAGMVIIQPSTSLIVVLCNTRNNAWFFPRGRKDRGESLESAALREAYEESGFQVEFLPLHIPTNAPHPPDNIEADRQPNTEPIFTTVSYWKPGRRGRRLGGEYITFWYVGQIPKDPVHTTGTGMVNEASYTTHLCTYEQAAELLSPPETLVLHYSWHVYQHSLRVEAGLASLEGSS